MSRVFWYGRWGGWVTDLDNVGGMLQCNPPGDACEVVAMGWGMANSIPSRLSRSSAQVEGRAPRLQMVASFQACYAERGQLRLQKLSAVAIPRPPGGVGWGTIAMSHRGLMAEKGVALVWGLWSWILCHSVPPLAWAYPGWVHPCLWHSRVADPRERIEEPWAPHLAPLGTLQSHHVAAASTGRADGANHRHLCHVHHLS